MSRKKKKEEKKKGKKKLIFSSITKSITKSITTIIGAIITAIITIIITNLHDEKINLDIRNISINMNEQIHFDDVYKEYTNVNVDETPFYSKKYNRFINDRAETIHSIPIIYKVQISNNSKQNVSINDIEISQHAHINNSKSDTTVTNFELLDKLIINGEEKELPLFIEPGETISMDITAKLMLRSSVNDLILKEYDKCNIYISFCEFFDLLAANKLYLNGDSYDGDSSSIWSLNDYHLIKLKTNKDKYYDIPINTFNSNDFNKIHKSIHRN